MNDSNLAKSELEAKDETDIDPVGASPNDIKKYFLLRRGHPVWPRGRQKEREYSLGL